MSTHNVIAGVVAPQSTSSCFKWEIKPFSMGCKNVGSYIDSPEFAMLLSGVVTRWKLQLYPVGRSNESRDHLSLFVNYLGSNAVTAKVSLSLLNDKNSKAVTHKMTQQSFGGTNGCSWGFEKFVSKSFLVENNYQVFLENTLRIQCEISWSEPIYYCSKALECLISMMKEVSDSSVDRFQLFDDFERILENGYFSDLTIVVGEKKFHAHKAIITGRSPVFEAMFKHDMREKEENIIEITDIKSEVMKEVLRFMYAGKVNNVEKMASDLLIATEKYSITGLKKLCAQAIYKNLKIENALEILKLADMCNAADLKLLVIEYIASNQKAIADKPEFGLFKDLHSELQFELVRAIIAKNSTQ